MLAIALYFAILTTAKQAHPGSPDQIASRDITTGAYSFAVKLFHVTDNGRDNIILSPYSLSSNLLLLLMGANGQTKSALASTLGVSKMRPSLLAAGNKALTENLSEKNLGNITVANSIWVASSVAVEPPLARAAEEYFGASILALTAQGTAGAGQVNAWVAGHTKNRIPHLFDTIGPDAAVILANALVFDGKWDSPFPRSHTTLRTFHGSEGDTRTPTMWQIGSVQMTTSNGTLYLRLPYQGGTALWIALPPQSHDPGQCIPSFAELPSLVGQTVKLYLPKFSFSSRHELRPALSKLGLAEMFRHANLTGISRDPRLGRVSQVVQDDTIELDEAGTIATAATGTSVAPTAMMREPQAPEIRVDRPFAFAIRDEFTGTLLFVGVVRNLK